MQRPIAAIQRVVARTAVQHIVAVAADQEIVATAAAQIIVAVAARQRFAPRAAGVGDRATANPARENEVALVEFVENEIAKLDGAPAKAGKHHIGAVLDLDDTREVGAVRTQIDAVDAVGEIGDFVVAVRAGKYKGVGAVSGSADAQELVPDQGIAAAAPHPAIGCERDRG